MILKHTSRSSGYKETSLKHGVVDVKWIQTLATTTLLLKNKERMGARPNSIYGLSVECLWYANDGEWIVMVHVHCP